MISQQKLLVAAAVTSLCMSGCAQMGGSSGTRSNDAAPESTATTTGPGMDADGNVTDATKVESGHGQKVKGINDYEGEITGKPAPGSKFPQLQIGMGMKQVQDIVGPPTDQGAYITGKAFIPFYFGSDRHRYELVYKGMGRLIFAGGSFGDFNNGNLIWVINAPNEPGYRN